MKYFVRKKAIFVTTIVILLCISSIPLIAADNIFYNNSNIEDHVLDTFSCTNASGRILKNHFVDSGSKKNSLKNEFISRGVTLYVGGSGPGNFTKIQDAIDNASDGDTIFVYSGTYFEHVVVDKQLYLLGEDKNTTIIDGKGNGNVICISVDEVSICNFTIQNSGIAYSNYAGIQIYSNENTIYNNIISNNKDGICIYSYSNSNNIVDNIIGPSINDGLRLFSSSNNNISRNTIIQNDDGIALSSSSNNNTIVDNTILSNNDCGIALSSSNDTIISGNNISDNNEGIHLFPNCIYTVISENTIGQNAKDGIYISCSTDNEILNNTIISNNRHGISFSGYSNDNVISENIISNNFDGIRLYTSSGNTIRGNTISNNYKGLRPYASSDDNLIYNNNLIGNTVGVHDTCTNQWDNGYPCAGNYWDDYIGSDDYTGPHQDMPMPDGDGIGDTPYYIDGGAIDNFPLMQPWDGTYISAPEIVYVDDDFSWSDSGWGYDYFDTVGDAFDVVVEGGEIFVYTGLYYETITINKMITLQGENNESTIIEYNTTGYGDIISIVCDDVTIHNLWIRSNGYSNGINIEANNSIITGNRITNTEDAIVLSSTKNNTISNNIISNNNEGIIIHQSTDSIIQGNKITTNEQYGILIYYSSQNTTLINNVLSNNFYGIHITSASANTLFNNILGPDNNCGIYISSTGYNNHIFHNDFINNNLNAYDEGSNIWDDGYPNGGNYWDDYTGSDGDDDGIGDIPYSISGGDNQDGFPLMEPWSENPPFSIVYVDDDYDETIVGWQIYCFNNIQDGVDAVGENGMVFVYNGIYYEDIMIYNSISLIGEDKNNTIIKGGFWGTTVVLIHADQVTIKDFTIEKIDWISFASGILVLANHVTIEGNILTNNSYAIMIDGHNNNTITGNIITGNTCGIVVIEAHSNIIIENSMRDNGYGVIIHSSSDNNCIYHNNFITNTLHAYDEDSNIWDDGYPSGGNYWDNYTGVDGDGDGIGDIPYSISGGSNQDLYPLMNPWEPITVVYVDDDYDSSTPGWQVDHFDSIQDGVDAVPEEGTVFVYNGTYFEQLEIDKPLYLIGEDKNGAIIDGGTETGDVVFLTSDRITIQGFTIQHIGDPTPWESAGLRIRSNHNSIIGNIIKNHGYGVEFEQFYKNTTFLDNNISSNSYEGMDISRCNNITISNNIFSSNQYNGIHAWECHDLTITGNGFFDNGLICGMSHDNTIVDNTVNGKPLVYLEDESDAVVDDAGQVILVRCDNVTVKDQHMSNLMVGIYLEYSTHCWITNNTLSNNEQGIQLRSSCNNTILGNVIDMSWYGIWVRFSSDFNTFLNNEISNADSGIYISESDNHLIVGNSITGGGSYYDGLKLSQTNNSIIIGNTIKEYDRGLAVSLSYNNTFYHNTLMDNDENAYDNGVNSWDNGYPSGGNYWDDYTGSDGDGDGIGDTPYSIPGGENSDLYPLMDPWEPTVVYVDDDYDSSTPGWQVDHFDSIQDGVDAVPEEGTVFVYNGTYFEHVIIDKQMYLTGEDKNSTIIDGEGSEDVVVIDADDVILENLKIINSGLTSGSYTCDSGIELINSYYCEIRNCIFTENRVGLGFCSSSYNIIENCLFEHNLYGIRAYGDLDFSGDDIGNQILNNIIQSNTGSGISFSHSWQYHRSNIIQGNIIANNGGGIYMILSYENEISYNTIVNNTGSGVYLDMCVCGGQYNLVHHNNFIGNNGGDVQAYDISNGFATNFWYDQDDDVGNFWSDYTGTDSDHDGIGDVSYEIPDYDGSTNQDLYPLMHQFTLGDMNVDEILNFFDIDPFLLALSNPGSYQSQYFISAILHGDCNQDDVLDDLDVDPFVHFLIDQDDWSPPLNNPPYLPTDPEPCDDAIDVAIHADLSWTGGDPDPEDSVTYDVYFEANDPTPDILVSQGQTYKNYNPGTLQSLTTYYWQIIAEDNHGAITPGPVWSFTTIDRIWSIETVDSEGNVGYDTSIAIDSNNYAHISYAYYDSTSEIFDLKYTQWTGSSWFIETVSSNIGSLSLAVDSSDQPNICYKDNGNKDLIYTKKINSIWTSEIVDSVGDVGSYSSIVLDSNGYPHISYASHNPDDGTYALKYARWDGSTWAIQTVDTVGNTGYDTSIAVDSNDYPHISYWHASEGDLKYARWTGSSWAIETVANGGQCTSIAIDSNDYPHISYWEAGLEYARWTGSSWVIETIEGAGGVYTSIALDSDDHPHISSGNFYDLMYSMWTGCSWSVEIVDEEGNVGGFTSIALDSKSQPHISYRDFTNSDLKYATCTSSVPDLLKPLTPLDPWAHETDDKIEESFDCSFSSAERNSPTRDLGALTLFFGPNDGAEACELYTTQECTYDIEWENGQATACLWATTENTDIWHGLAIDFQISGDCEITAGQMFNPSLRWHPSSDIDPTDGDIECMAAVYEQGLGAYPADDYGYLCGDVFLYKVAELTFSSDSSEPCDVFMAVGDNGIVKRGSPVGEPVYFGFCDDYILGDEAGAMSVLPDLHINFPRTI